MNKIERYKQVAVDALGDMSKAAAEAKAAYVKAERDEHGAQNAFNEGITGRTGLARRMETIKADKDRAEKAKIKEFVGRKRELGTICSFCRSAMFKTIVQKSQKMKNKLFDNAESLNIIRFAIGNTGAFALGA